jgi:hypothetical protein
MERETADMTDRELRRAINKEFWDRGLSGPSIGRLGRLMREVRDGRTLESIGKGLDDYLAERRRAHADRLIPEAGKYQTKEGE